MVSRVIVDSAEVVISAVVPNLSWVVEARGADMAKVPGRGGEVRWAKTLKTLGGIGESSSVSENSSLV